MSRCILLIEDNTEIRENTIELLELAEFEVICATNGRQGLDILKSRTPDLILSDILMPSMNGYDFLNLVRQDKKFSHIPFIFFSAFSDKKDVDAGIGMGAVDYVVKPFDSDELIQLIQKYLPG